MLITGRSKPDCDRRMDHVLTSNALWTLNYSTGCKYYPLVIRCIHSTQTLQTAAHMAIARRAHHAKIWPTATGLTKGVVPC